MIPPAGRGEDEASAVDDDDPERDRAVALVVEYGAEQVVGVWGRRGRDLHAWRSPSRGAPRRDPATSARRGASEDVEPLQDPKPSRTSIGSAAC